MNKCFTDPLLLVDLLANAAEEAELDRTFSSESPMMISGCYQIPLVQVDLRLI